jgi:uridylate kinase
MTHRFGRTVVVALGGSIVYPHTITGNVPRTGAKRPSPFGVGACPDGIDVAFVRKFKRFLAPFVRHKVRFVIVIGGGQLSRNFQTAAARVAPVTDEDKDWIGIHATRLNAHLLRTIFREIADPVIIDARHKLPKLTHPVTIASGWRPGWSTDFVAAASAADYGAKEFVVAGKPSHVFDKDPHVHDGAVPFETLSWRDYRKLIPAQWKPGAHAPVDPVAAKFAQKEKLTAVIIDGRNLKNFVNLLNGKEFWGTIIT